MIDSTQLIEVSRAFRCRHCRKLYTQLPAAEKHAKHCIQNLYRTPRDGEVTRSDQWACQEPCVGRHPQSPWHPRVPGKCWYDGAWRDVPGFEVIDGKDIWPDVADEGGYDNTGPGDPAWYPWEGASISFYQIPKSRRCELMALLDFDQGDPDEWGFQSNQRDVFADPYVAY